MTRLILASASPARMATLKSAGFSPEVRVSGVDERAAVADAAAKFGQHPDAAEEALLLAQAKAQAVARDLMQEDAEDEDGADDAIVIGCDSVLEFEGQSLGKPADAAEALQRVLSYSTKSGVLHTGHWILDERDPELGGTGATFGEIASTTVHFGTITEKEARAYVETGEPLNVAGAFTLDGLGGSFIDGVDGDPHNVVGICLPLLRAMLGHIGVDVPSLWTKTG